MGGSGVMWGDQVSCGWMRCSVGGSGVVWVDQV